MSLLKKFSELCRNFAPQTRIRDLLRGAWAEARARPLIFFILFPAAMIAAVVLLFPRDVAISDAIYANRSHLLREIARRCSWWGDFKLTVEIFIVCLVVGHRKRSENWKRTGLVILLAASLAGATATTVRTLTGRPRPSAKLEDRFLGPHFIDHKEQSFPSAHAATSMATATALAVIEPPVGIPFLLISTSVPWSRLYMHDHYLSDITVGSLVGIWFGTALGLAGRKFQRLEKSQP